MSDTIETVVNPYDLQPIGTVEKSSWGLIDQYLDEAQKLYRDKQQWLPSFERIKILEKAANLMRDRQESLAMLIASEGGKPLIDARIEVTRAIDGIQWCVKELCHQSGRQVPMDLTEAGVGKMAFSYREPIGVVGAISAFNHPLNLIVHQVAPAVAVGCPVLVKPAEDTPLSCLNFVQILYEAGLPEPWCRAIVCEVKYAEQMVTDSRIDFLSFIGSAKVGWSLRSKLAPGTRCALEHGGVAPVIIGEDAQIESLIPSLMRGGFYHSGQVCVSVQRIYAPSDKVQTLAQALAQRANALVVGNAIDEVTQCGPLIRPQEVDRVEQWVNEAKALGAKVVCGGERGGSTTYQPTVLLEPSVEAKVSTEEIFGPVVCVYGYDNVMEAIDRANALPFAFQASVFTNDLTFAHQAIKQLDAATVMVNDHTAFRVDWMPFAGRRRSGYQVGGIGYTMHDMTQEKLAVMHLG